MSCLFSPVTIITKCYAYFLEEETSDALRELIYPRFHPIFDEWLKQTAKNHSDSDKKTYFSSAETDKSYKPISFLHEGSPNKDHRLKKNSQFEDQEDI